MLINFPYTLNIALNGIINSATHFVIFEAMISGAFMQSNAIHSLSYILKQGMVRRTRKQRKFLFIIKSRFKSLYHIEMHICSLIYRYFLHNNMNHNKYDNYIDGTMQKIYKSFKAM